MSEDEITVGALLLGERVGRKAEGVTVDVLIDGTELALRYWINGVAARRLPDVVEHLRTPQDAERVVRRLYNTTARMTNAAERGGFPHLAESVALMASNAYELRELVIEVIAGELRRRDAVAALEADPELSLADAADRYGCEVRAWAAPYAGRSGHELSAALSGALS